MAEGNGVGQYTIGHLTNRDRKMVCKRNDRRIEAQQQTPLSRPEDIRGNKFTAERHNIKRHLPKAGGITASPYLNCRKEAHICCEAVKRDLVVGAK